MMTLGSSRRWGSFAPVTGEVSWWRSQASMACLSYVCPSPAITGSHMTACTCWADTSHTNCSCLPQGHRGSVMVACTSQGFAVMCCCCIARLCLTLVKGQLRRFAKTPMARACSLLDTTCALLTASCSLLEAACFAPQATPFEQPLHVAWICRVDIIDDAACPGCSASWLPTGLLSCGIAPVPHSCWSCPNPRSGC